MEVKIIKIGNSQGIRIPKAMLEQVGLSGVAELIVENGKIVLQRKEPEPRAGGKNILLPYRPNSTRKIGNGSMRILLTTQTTSNGRGSAA